MSVTFENITIRRANSKDVSILTGTPAMLISANYIEKNSVFIAEITVSEKKEIVGCCAIHEIKQAIRHKEELIEPGYWLEQFFVQAEDDKTATLIAKQLLNHLKVYCLSNQIQEIKTLNDKAYYDFYIKMGAIEKGNQLIFELDAKDKLPSLQQKLEDLDSENWEDELYDEEELSYLEEEPFDDTDDINDIEESLYLEEEVFNKTTGEIEDSEEIFEHKPTSFKPVMHIVAETINKEEKEEKNATSRLSYAACQKAVVPISYTFEKDEQQTVDYEKILEKQEEMQINETVYSYPLSESVQEDSEEKRLYEVAYTKIKKWMNEEPEDIKTIVSENKQFDKQRAKIILNDFNRLESDESDKAYALLEKLFGKLGEEVHIEPYFKCSYGYNIKIGDNFYADANCIIDDHALVTIGDDCILSPQVGIYTLAYPLNPQKRKEGLEYARPVHIGNNVWIGGGATIYPGVTIGDNVVISPGAVVINDIPDDVLVAGNPAQIID